MKTKYSKNFCWEQLISSPEQFNAWKRDQTEETLKKTKVICSDGLMNGIREWLQTQDNECGYASKVIIANASDLEIKEDSDFWARSGTATMFRFVYVLEEVTSGLWVGHAENSDWYVCTTDRNKYTDSIALEDFMDGVMNRANPVTLAELLEKTSEIVHNSTSYVSLVKWTVDNGFIAQKTIEVDNLFSYAYASVDDFYALYDSENFCYILPFVVQ